MKYMGSKLRIMKDILPIMLKERKPYQCWVEPFVGGGNSIDKVDGWRIGADINNYTIEALCSIRDCVNYFPKNNTEFTEEDYKHLQNGSLYPYKGYAGFTFSYGGKWMGGWARNKTQRDYVREAYNNAKKQSILLQGVEFIHTSYSDLHIPSRSLIYNDPPYRNTTNYRNKNTFDSDAFWQWCREKEREGHTVFVSEYTAPDDFECVWSKEIWSNLVKNKKGIEKLFRYIGK